MVVLLTKHIGIFFGILEVSFRKKWGKGVLGGNLYGIDFPAPSLTPTPSTPILFPPTKVLAPPHHYKVVHGQTCPSSTHQPTTSLHSHVHPQHSGESRHPYHRLALHYLGPNHARNLPCSYMDNLAPRYTALPFSRITSIRPTQPGIESSPMVTKASEIPFQPDLQAHRSMLPVIQVQRND